MATVEEILAMQAGDPKQTAGNMNIGYSQPYQEKNPWSDYDINGAIFENLENRRSRNQGFLDTLAIGSARLVGKTLTKTVEGAGLLAGLLGVDNHNEDYGGGGMGWVAGAADNGLAKLAADMEKNLEDITPLYNSLEDKAANKVSVFHNLADGDFWAGDAVDATAFLLSAYLTGSATGLLKTGAGAANLLNAGSKLAKTVDWATATAITTASESMFEAKDFRDTQRESIAKDRYGVPFENLSKEQQVEINTEVAPAAAQVFGANMIALAPSNFMQMASLMKNAGRVAGKVEGLGTRGLMTSVAEPTGKLFGANVPYLSKGLKGFQKFAGTKGGKMLTEASKQVLSEGFYEENIQTAIQDHFANNPDSDLFDGTLKSLKDAGSIIGGMKDNLSTEEGKKSVLLGGLIGGLGGLRSGYIDHGRDQKAKANAILNTTQSLHNLLTTNDVFQKEEYDDVDAEGKPVKKSRMKLDGKGQPMVDDVKLQQMLAKRDHIEYLDDIAQLAEEKGDDVLANLSKKAALAEWVKSHFDTGTEHLLDEKISFIENMSDEEFAKQGMDPASRPEMIASMKQSKVKFQELAKNIEKNLIFTGGSKEKAAKFTKRKSELYNIGTTLETVRGEQQRLAAEKAQLEADPQTKALSEKRLAYIDLKLNELGEAHTKFSEEFNKIANNKTGQKYFDNDWKKSITKKTTTFNPETTSLDHFTAFEDSQLYGEELNMKGQNIESEFIEKGVEDRLQTEEAPEVIADLRSDKVAVTSKTKDRLTKEVDDKLASLEEIAQAAQDLMVGGDTDGYSQEVLDAATAMLNGDTSVEEAHNKYSEAKANLEDIAIRDKAAVNSKSAKESLIREIKNVTEAAVFNAENSEEYVNLSELEKVKRMLTNMIKVLTEKNDPDYSDTIAEYEKQLVKINDLIDVVKARIADKNLEQERIFKDKIQEEENTIGLDGENILIQELFDIIKLVSGLDLIEDLKKLTDFEKIGYINNVLFTIRGQLTDEQRKAIADKKDELVGSLLNKINSLSKGSLDAGALDRINKIYSVNPKLGINNIVQFLGKRSEKLFSTFFKDFNFTKFYKGFLAEGMPSRYDQASTKEIYDLHRQVMALVNTLDYINGEYNPVSEVVTEKSENTNPKVVTPSKEQLFSIRELVKFFLGKRNNTDFGNFAYLKGAAGTGKTTVVIKWFTKMLGVKASEIYATGHNEHSSKAINLALETNQTRSLDQLIVDLESGQFPDTKLILIDEVNAVASDKLIRIMKAVNHLNSTKGTSVRVVGLGDPNQITEQAVAFNNSVVPLEDVTQDEFVNMTIISPLTVRYRSNVTAVVDAQDMFIDQKKDLRKEKIYLSSNPEGTLGAKGSMSSDAIERELRSKDLNDGRTRAIIVHPDDVAAWKAKNLGIEVVSYVDVQGRTLDEVYVAIPGFKFAAVNNFNQAMYTATSRAKDFVFIQGMNAENVTDSTINDTTAKNTQDIKDQKENFDKDRIAELSQLDDGTNPPQGPAPKPGTTQTTPPVTPPITPDPNDPDDHDPEDEEDPIEDTEPEDFTQPEPPTEPTPEPPKGSGLVLNVSYPTKPGLSGNGTTIPPAQAGEDVVYVATTNRQGNVSIGIFLERPEGYLEIGMMSQEEVENLPDEYKVPFKEALKGLTTEFDENADGYKEVSVVSTGLNAIARGKINHSSPLKYTFKSTLDSFSWANIKKKFESFFTENPTYKPDEVKIRVFTKTEIQQLEAQGVTFKLYSGRPYVIFENPTQGTGKRVIPQIIPLIPKRLNTKLHNFLTQPLVEFNAKYKQLASLLPQLSVNDLALFIEATPEYTQKTLIPQLESKYGSPIHLTNEINNLKAEIDELLHQPLDAKDFEIKKGIYVKNQAEPWLVDGKEITGRVVEVNGDVAKIDILSRTIEVPVSDLKAQVKRAPGKAQHAFNLIARANRAVGDIVIRKNVNVKSKSGKTKTTTSGKSILPKHPQKTVDEFMAEFATFPSKRQRAILTAYRNKFGKDFPIDTYAEEDVVDMQQLVHTSITPTQLDAILSEDSEGNMSSLHVPIPMHNQDYMGSSMVVDYTENYTPSANDSIFFDENLESITPTSLSVTIDGKVTPPKPKAPKGSISRTRLSGRNLAKDVTKALGRKRTTSEIFAYLKSIDKTLTPEQVKFVSEAEMLRISGGENWGHFKDGIIYLEQDKFDEAYENVARHELFHRVFNMMLTPAQKKTVTNKVIEESGMVNPSEEQVDEYLAEKYQEWRDQSPVSNFFNILFNRLKRWLGMQVDIIPNIDTFFGMIEGGFFSEIVGLGEFSRDYNDILKDFKSTAAFREAQLIIISRLNSLRENSYDLENVDEGYVPENDRTNLGFVYQDILDEIKEGGLSDEDVVYVDALNALSVPRIFNATVADMFEGTKSKVSKKKDNVTPDTTVDNTEVIGSDWTDTINDAEQTNHEASLSKQVKQFLSSIVDGITKTQINPRFAFLVCLETMSNISMNTEKAFKQELDDRFRYFKKFGSSAKDVDIIKEHLLKLAKVAYASSYQGVQIGKDIKFINDNTIQRVSDGKFMARKKGETNLDYFSRIEASTGTSLKDISANYLVYSHQNVFVELYAQVGSLYRQNVVYGEYGGSKEKYTQDLKNATKEIQVTSYVNNIVSNMMINLKGNIEGVAPEQWVIRQLNKFAHANSETKTQIIKDIYKNLFSFDVKLVDNVEASKKQITDIISYYQKEVKTDNDYEKFESQILDEFSGHLSSLAQNLITAETELRPASYRRTDKKIAYLFTLSSQAINTLQHFVNPSLYEKPAFLNSEFYKHNIFNNALSKIHSYVNFDGVVGNYDSRAVRYKGETSTDWYRRNFKYFFLANFADNLAKKKSTYIQQFLTISNKPNIVAAEVDFLDWHTAERSVIAILNQQNAEFSGVKYKNLNPFEKLAGPQGQKSNEDYAEEVIAKMREKGKDFKEVFEMENYMDKNKLRTVLNHTFDDAVTPENTEEAIDNLLGLYYANFYINSNQLNQIAAGPEGFYKNSFDVIKRMSIAFATGYKGMVNDKFGLNKTYRSLVVNDIKGILGDDFIQFAKIWGKDFEVTDAQGFMTPDRAANLRKGFGEAFKLGSVVKPVHFEIDPNGIPRAVKYSCVELTPELCDMFPKLQKVLDTMKSAKVDEMVFKSAVKVGRPSEMVTPNDDGSLPEVKEDSGSIMTLQNENYRIQSNPEHDVLDDTVAFPTQLGYFANFSGQNTELANRLFKAQERLMQIGLSELLNKLGMNSRFKEGDAQSVFTQMNRVRKELVKKNASEQDQRQNEALNNPKLGINTPFLVKKVITELASMFSKSTVGIRIPGSGLILQSAYGTAEYTDKDGNLVRTDLKWRDKDGYAECVLPDFWKGDFKAGDVLMFDKMLGFRIPSTELHSALPIKVVGFYPSNKNVIIAPKEIVFFHGSDYDVDKLYVMRRSSYENDVYDLENNQIYSKGTPIGYDSKGNFDFEWIQSVEEVIFDTKNKLFQAVKDRDLVSLTATKDKLKELEEVQSLYYKNQIVESFLQITTNKINEELMMAPITMERFKGMGIEEDSAFDLVARLSGFTEPKPVYSDYATADEYGDAVNKWLDKRNDVIFKERNLYDLEDQMLMHKDNFSGTVLTGMFADSAKVIAYYHQSTTDGTNPKLKEQAHVTLNGTTYDSFVYDENSGESTVNYDKNGKPIKSKHLVTEAIDSLINAAIDNVKEQILSIIGFTNNTGAIAVSFIGMGIPVNEVVLLMRQPVSDGINESNSFDRGARNVEDVLITLIKGKSKKDLTPAVLEELEEEVSKVEITTEKLEEAFGKKVSEMTEEDLMFQYAVLKTLKKGEKTSKSLSIGIKALRSLKGFPIDFSGIEDMLHAFDSLIEKEEREANSDVEKGAQIFENVDIIKLPHINKAYGALKTLKSKIEHLFYVHNPALQDFSEAFSESNIFKFRNREGMTGEKANIEGEVAIREAMIQYMMVGLNYTTPEGYKISNDTSVKKTYTSSLGQTYTGLEAFNKEFIDKVLTMKRDNPKNRFLKQLYYNKTSKKLEFGAAKGLSMVDLLDYQLAFQDLKENGQYTELQYEFVKYAAINDGLRFGISSYSLVLPMDIYEPLMEEFNRWFGEVSSNPALFQHILAKVKSNFTLQFAINNAEKSIPYMRQGEYTRVHDTIKVSKELIVDSPPLFIKEYDNLYMLTVRDAAQWEYSFVVNFKNNKGYQFNWDLLAGTYDVNEAFNPKYSIIRTSDNTTGKVSSKFEYADGQKVRIVNYSDLTRMNMVEGTIVSKSFNQKTQLWDYKIADPILVSTIRLDSDIVNSQEFKDLVEKGLLPEAALHKIKENC